MTDFDTIVHLTTAHLRSDSRIRYKTARSVAENLEARVVLIVQDGLPPETEGNLEIISSGPRLPRQRNRLISGIWRAGYLTARIKPKIVHFHDPELVLVCLFLKLHGVAIIYDVHEDLPRQVMSKTHIAPWLRRLLSVSTKVLHLLAGRCFDQIIAATPVIAKRFPALHTTVVHNFPIVEEFPVLVQKNSGPPGFCYVGGLTETRGIRQIVEAVGRLQGRATLEIAGTFASDLFQKDISSLSGWQYVKFHGWQDRTQIAKILSRSVAGLVTLHPIENYLDALPIKMFEYMAAGIPVIASDFAMWREILEEERAGLTVDPLNVDAIVKVMQIILDNPKNAKAMGLRARCAVERKYNWTSQERPLLDTYMQLGIQRKAFGN